MQAIQVPMCLVYLVSDMSGCGRADCFTPAFAECAAESGAGAIIVSGSDTSELQRIASTYQIHIHADEICCSLVPCHDRVIDEFTSVLGMPVFRISVEGGVVSDVGVIRGSPCGASWWVASQLPGTPVADAPAKARLLAGQYLCRALRGTRCGIHRSAEIHKKAVEAALADGYAEPYLSRTTLWKSVASKLMLMNSLFLSACYP